MVKANALFIVIIISLIIGIFCSSIIIISYYNRIQIQANQLVKRLEYNVNSGLAILLADAEETYHSEGTSLDLFNEGMDSVILKRQSWGIFEVAVVKAFSGKAHKVKSLLVGYEPDEKAKAAIYIPDQNQQLAIAGNTSVKGLCYLPEQGVKRAYIEGQSFSGTNLIEGQIRKSQATLPELNKRIIGNILSILENKIVSEDSKVIQERDTIYRSFIDKALPIHVSGGSELNGKALNGNVIVFSNKCLIIDSTTRLNNVIVCAPSVVFKENFYGNVQVFCTDSIVVSKNCQFGYPSVLGILKTDFEVMQPFIRLEEGAKLKGIVFTHCVVQDLQKTIVRMEKGSFIEGQIYSHGFVDLRGTLLGNVTCEKFILKTASGLYENHLLNASIDPSKRSSHFIGSSLIYSENRKRVVKWLE